MKTDEDPRCVVEYKEEGPVFLSPSWYGTSVTQDLTNIQYTTSTSVTTGDYDGIITATTTEGTVQLGTWKLGN